MKEYIMNGEYKILYNDIEDLKCIADIIIDQIQSWIGGLELEEISEKLIEDNNREISNTDDFNNSYLMTDGEIEYYIKITDESDMEFLLDELVDILNEYYYDDIDAEELIETLQDEGYEVITIEDEEEEEEIDED